VSTKTIIAKSHVDEQNEKQEVEEAQKLVGTEFIQSPRELDDSGEKKLRYDPNGSSWQVPCGASEWSYVHGVNSLQGSPERRETEGRR
jgi:hypothetical protein